MKMILLEAKITQNSPDFCFPKDEGRHVDALHEWWYLNSHIETKTGQCYGLYIGFFSAHIMMVMLVDKSSKCIVKRIEKKITLKASKSYLNLEFDYGWWRQVSGDPFHYTLYLNQGELNLSLDLLSCKPPLFVNHSGRIRQGLLGYSRYYALTNLNVSGILNLNGKRFEVKGIGWIDRQWGSWDFGGVGDWNWFSIQLANKVEILAAQCFHPITGSPSMKLLNLIDKEGRTKVYDKFGIKCLKKWKSPRTDLVYGAGWRISMPRDTNLLIFPVVDDQEIYKGLWEGCCDVQGTLQGQPINGVGYAEQFYFEHGYARASSLFRLISLGTAPFHYVGQLVLGRVDFKVWELLQYGRLNRLFKRKEESILE